jgi:hypothetical protein
MAMSLMSASLPTQRGTLTDVSPHEDQKHNRRRDKQD